MYDARQNAIRSNQFHQDNWKSSKYDFEYLYLFICCLIVLYHLFHCHCCSALFSSSVCPRPLIYCLRQQPLILSKRRQTSEENICFPWHRIIYERMQVLMLNEFDIMRYPHICTSYEQFVCTFEYSWFFKLFSRSPLCWRSKKKCLKLVILSRVFQRKISVPPLLDVSS